ncbi:MAG: phage regulatory CII family protein [Planctomycetota bacterium]
MTEEPVTPDFDEQPDYVAKAREKKRRADAFADRREVQRDMAPLFKRCVKAAKAAGAPGASLRQIARKLGIAKTKVQSWTYEHETALPSIADVWCMPKSVAREVLSALAAKHGLLVIDAPKVEACKRSHVRRIMDCNREHSEAMHVYLSGVEDDDDISPDEAHGIERETMESIREQYGVVLAMRGIRAKAKGEAA